MSSIILESKLAGETRNYTFDFSSRLAVGETISTKVTTATVYSGTDASPSSLINGAASASGAIVTQSLTAGTSGVIYALVCTITTSTSQTLILSAFMAVVPNVI